VRDIRDRRAVDASIRQSYAELMAGVRNKRMTRKENTEWEAQHHELIASYNSLGEESLDEVDKVREVLVNAHEEARKRGGEASETKKNATAEERAARKERRAPKRRQKEKEESKEEEKRRKEEEKAAREERKKEEKQLVTWSTYRCRVLIGRRPNTHDRLFVPTSSRYTSHKSSCSTELSLVGMGCECRDGSSWLGRTDAMDSCSSS
jgi:hypothetical protein